MHFFLCILKGKVPEKFYLIFLTRCTLRVMKSLEIVSSDAVYPITLNNIINMKMKRMEIGYLEGILPHTYEVCQTKTMWLSLCYTYLSGISNTMNIFIREKRGWEEQTIWLSKASALNQSLWIKLLFFSRDLGIKNHYQVTESLWVYTCVFFFFFFFPV